MSISGADGRSKPGIVISSEPLDDLHDSWHAVPPGHLLRVDPDWTVRLDPIGEDG